MVGNIFQAHCTVVNGYSDHTAGEREFGLLFPTNAFGLGYKPQRRAQKSSRYNFKWVGTYNHSSSSSRHRTSQIALLGRSSEVASLSSRHLLRRLVEKAVVLKTTGPPAYSYNETGSWDGTRSKGRKCRESPILCILWTVFLCSRRRRGKKRKKKKE